MHRARQLAEHFAASVFAVWLLTDVAIQACQVLAHTPACTRSGSSNGAEVIAEILVDWRMIECAVKVRAVAGQVELVA